jgi:hypothetical protein
MAYHGPHLPHVHDPALRETSVEETAHELQRMYRQFGTETIRDLYLAERNRRLQVRAQLAVPASVISFAIFGYISFGQAFDASDLSQPLSAAMLGLFLGSMLLILLACFYLVRLEYRYMVRQVSTDETPTPEEDERDFLIERYTLFVRVNDKAANDRARAFSLIVLALVLFVILVALLPFHIAQTGGSAGAG